MSDFLAQAAEYIEYAENEMKSLRADLKDCEQDNRAMIKALEREEDRVAAFKIEIGIDPNMPLTVADMAEIKAAVQSVLYQTKVW